MSLISIFNKSISKGFVVDNHVWIVVADAHIFGYRELDNFIAKLKAHLKSGAEEAGEPKTGSSQNPTPLDKGESND